MFFSTFLDSKLYTFYIVLDGHGMDLEIRSIFVYHMGVSL